MACQYPDLQDGTLSIAEATRRILSSAWSRSRGNQFDISPTAHRLARYVKFSSSNPNDTLRNAVEGLLETAFASPQSVDSLLQVYEETSGFIAGEGTDPEFTHENAINKLRDGIDRFTRPLPTQEKAERYQSRASATASSTQTHSIQETIRRIDVLRNTRRRQVVTAAMQSRCFALNLFPISSCRRLITRIEAGLQPRAPLSDITTTTSMLRASARTLSGILASQDATTTQDQWRKALESALLHLHQDADSDLQAKIHISVSQKAPPTVAWFKKY